MMCRMRFNSTKYIVLIYFLIYIDRLNLGNGNGKKNLRNHTQTITRQLNIEMTVCLLT